MYQFARVLTLTGDPRETLAWAAGDLADAMGGPTLALLRMVESMEAAGLVGPLQANGTREILVPVAKDE